MNRFRLFFLALASMLFHCSAFGYFYPDKTLTTDFVDSIEITEFSSGMRNVACIYVLNLAERPERWERTKKNFQEQGLSVNRVNAVNGWKIPYWRRAVVTGPYLIRMTAGHLGCAISHIGIYKDAYKRGFNIAWICEDDIEFRTSAEYVDQMVEQLTKLDPDWDLFYTDLKTHGNGVQDPRPGQPLYQPEFRQINDLFYKIHSRCTTHSIIFSRRGLKKLVEYYEHVYLWCPIDIDIHHIPNLREYSSAKDLVAVIGEGSCSDTENRQLP